MKKALLLFALAALSMPAVAQSIRVDDQQTANVVPNGTTLTYWIPAMNGSSPYLDERPFTVTNISNSTKTFKVRKVNITLADPVNSSTLFCTDLNCYGPGQMLSYNVPMNSNASFELKLDYNTGGSAGVTRVSYTIYDINNVNDSMMLTLVYNITNGPVSVTTNLAKPSVSNPQPNPASEMFAINFKMGSTQPSDAKLIVYNMLGAAVIETEITSAEGTIRMDVSTLPAGVYFCTLTNNGRQLATKRLAVTH